jgi:hypothetical protein
MRKEERRQKRGIEANLNFEFLIDFVFDGETVAIPTEAALNVVTRLMGVSRHGILQHRHRQRDREKREERR